MLSTEDVQNPAWPACPPCLLFAQPCFFLQNQALDPMRSALLTVLSTECVQNPVWTNWRCLVFTQSKFSFMNQGLDVASRFLLTILSTKGVQNSCGPSGRRGRRNNFSTALFLRSNIFSFKIRHMAEAHESCAQSYPQKMCRTVLAVWLATRYIAGVVPIRMLLILRSLFCSPFFKLQAGLSGYC
jgi:hypothetical protein